MENYNNIYHMDIYYTSFMKRQTNPFSKCTHLNVTCPAVSPQYNTRGQGCTVYHTFIAIEVISGASKNLTDALALT